MAAYRYGKTAKVRRSQVRAVGPTSRELEARMASAPPIPDRIGDQQRQRSARALYGQDGATPPIDVPGNPQRAPMYPWIKKRGWRGREGNARTPYWNPAPRSKQGYRA